MTATTQVKPWDFSHVLDLVNSLSTKPDASYEPPTTHPSDHSTRPDRERHANHENQEHVDEDSRSLGDFSKLWQFLGSPSDLSSSAPNAQTIRIPDTQVAAFQISTNYTSDGAIDTTLSSKRKARAKHQSQISPLKEQSSADEADADTLSDGSTIPETPTLTKNQRKKANRKERRAQEAALAAEKASAKAARRTAKALAALSESEANHATRSSTPAKKASIHALATPPSGRYNLRPRDANGKAICATEPRIFPKVLQSIEPHTPLQMSKKSAPATLPKVVKPAGSENLSKSNIVQSTEPYALSQAVESAAKLLDTTKKQKEQNSSASKANREVVTKEGPLIISINGPRAANHALLSRPNPYQTNNAFNNGTATKFLPSSVQPSPASVSKQIPAQKLHSSQLLQSAGGPAANIIVPIISRSKEDRHWAFLLKLIGDFYEDRKYLISPMNLTTHNNDPRGIHVFVDASNIFIGFMDQLKRSRGIDLNVQIPSVDLSFDALALLMERRRPVAKRILVGSTPHLPAFDKAKAVGYECNILEKVYKARELTERQIFFKEQDRAYHDRKKRAKAPPANNVATLNKGSGSGSGSGSETNAPQYAPARMIEQGVDEILHLKILESVVDTDVPGTMVLATGDAARAEYSEGFMAMAERALKKGWTVELVSWSKNVSQMYTRREWTSAWGERFRVITLDDYAEELLDM